ncbi:hypothetical protein GF1_12010 [Desulfolithobacter dissulfuricans]|uniref:DUF4124 domain-containing protein n=2 Tax=Desulfolithobacter dissulfuricans TaxID=2795293 RepID=A0A915U9X3_9BACT|nr:hypothetical protein GF1_12010 [Desulfolithobacter dissulfuricans]
MLSAGIFIAGLSNYIKLKQKDNKAITLYKKDSAENQVATKNKKNKIYKWTDKDGKTHYSNVPVGPDRIKVIMAKFKEVERIRAEKKKKNEDRTLKYIVYLKDGGKVECSGVNKNENIIIAYTKTGLITNIDESKIDKIIKYQIIDNKVETSTWKK